MHIVTREKLVELLEKEEINMHVIGRALAHLKNRQTQDEIYSQNTKYHNKMGFTPADAFMGTSMAEFYSRRGYLSPKQCAYWLRRNKKGIPRLAKYWKQLDEEAQKKAA